MRKRIIFSFFSLFLLIVLHGCDNPTALSDEAALSLPPSITPTAYAKEERRIREWRSVYTLEGQWIVNFLRYELWRKVNPYDTNIRSPYLAAMNTLSDLTEIN